MNRENIPILDDLICEQPPIVMSHIGGSYTGHITVHDCCMTVSPSCQSLNMFMVSMRSDNSLESKVC